MDEQDQLALILKALAEMRANGYGNYIPQCIRPILDDFNYAPVYRPRGIGPNGEVCSEFVSTPPELR